MGRVARPAPILTTGGMEGVALAMGKDVTIFRERGLPVGRLLSVGGGARNELWNQIKADVTRVPLEIADIPEAGLQGAALLAATGVGLIDDPAEVAISRRTSTHVVKPNADLFPAYEASQRQFMRLYDHLLGFWADA